MHHDGNVVGPNVAKYRYKQGMTQDELVGKMQLRGCYMTRDILSSIETRRCPVTDKQIEFFADVFGIPVAALFPEKPNLNGGIVGLTARIVTRRRPRTACRPRSHRLTIRDES